MHEFFYIEFEFNFNIEMQPMPKPAKQARTRKTRQALMKALENLLKNKGFEQITVTEIAATAGVSTGLLYAHFKNKKDFLEALLDAYKARILTRLEEVEAQDICADYKAAGSLRAALREIANHAYRQLLEDAHLLDAVMQYLREQPDVDHSEWQDIRTRAALTIIPVLDVYADQVTRTDDALTRKMLVYFFNSIFAEALRTQQLGRTESAPIQSEVFTHEIGDFAYGYLTMNQE